MHDRWHEEVTDFIDNCTGKLFWSNCVQSEFERKFKEIVKNINSFLNKVSLILDDGNMFFNYFEFEKFILDNTRNCILDKTKKIKIIEFFWNTRISDNYVLGMYLVEFGHQLKKEYKKRRGNIKNRMSLHDCGLNNHVKYKFFRIN